MSLELIKDKIVLDHRIGQESVQIILEDDVIVPDIKPDISKILQVEGKIDLDPLEITADRVGCTGKMQLQILYAAQGADKPVHNMMTVFEIEDFIHVEGAQKDMTGEVQWEIEHLDYRLLNERKIHIQVVIQLTTTVLQKVDSEVLVDVKGLQDIQIQKDPLPISRIIHNNQENFIIKDELSIPAGKPNVQEILRFHPTIINKDIKIIEDRIVLKGDLHLCILYTGYHDEVPVHFIEYEIPFNGILECPGVTEDMYYQLDLDILEKYIQVKPDLDGEERVLDIEVVVGTKAKVRATETIQVIDDVYCPGKKVNIKREPMEYQKIICKNKTQSVLKESISLPSSIPQVKEVYYATGIPKVEDIQLVEDKVVIEGVVFIKFFYATDDSEYFIAAYEETIPFRQVLETKGTNLNMQATITASLEYISCTILSPEEVEVRISLLFDALVCEEKKFHPIITIEVKDIDPEDLTKIPSMIIYVVQKGDTLWKIAKKYNTTVDELALLNDIEDVDVIYPGQKLLILKKVIEI
ncbi:MAG: DUF3794 domain-containing protein [Epulopiscium sp.]|nr:DUF3794 domain-containing protein [Candidatus Epulonipiscium sp.]